MKRNTIPDAFSVAPTPTAKPIAFELDHFQHDTGKSSYAISPMEYDEERFLAAARGNYSKREILDYYLYQTGFDSRQEAEQGALNFLNDMTGCARLVRSSKQ